MECGKHDLPSVSRMSPATVDLYHRRARYDQCALGACEQAVLQTERLGFTGLRQTGYHRLSSSLRDCSFFPRYLLPQHLTPERSRAVSI